MLIRRPYQNTHRKLVARGTVQIKSVPQQGLSHLCQQARERGLARSPMRSTALCGESGGLVPSEVPGQDRDIRWHTVFETWGSQCACMLGKEAGRVHP